MHQFLGSFAEQLSQHLSIPLLLLPEQEPRHHSLAEWKEPITCLVVFAGSQPEPFLIQQAASLLAALSEHELGHLHFVPLPRSRHSQPGRISISIWLHHLGSSALSDETLFSSKKPKETKSQVGAKSQASQKCHSVSLLTSSMAFFLAWSSPSVTPREIEQHLACDLLDCLFHRGRKTLSGCETFSLNSIDQEARRQLSQGARQRERLRDPEGMG